MTRAPHELFKRRPFMERTFQDDVKVLTGGLVGFTAAALLFGDVAPLGFAIFLGAGLLLLVVENTVRHVIRQRRDAASRMAPPD
jgi:hypothetical protein